MPVLVVTRLRLRDPALLTEYFTAGAAMLRQAKKADGNLGADVLGDSLRQRRHFAERPFWPWRGRLYMLLRGYGGRRRLWLAGARSGRLPDPGRQQDHRRRKWQHIQDHNGPGGYRLPGDFQVGEEQDRQPARKAPASPQRYPMSSGAT